MGMTASLSQGALRAAFFAPMVAGAAGTALVDRDDASHLAALAVGGAAMLTAVPAAMSVDYLMFRHGSTKFIVDGAEQVIRRWSPLRMGATGEAITAIVAGAGLGMFAASLGGLGEGPHG
jgi:hypothetical protein